MGRHVKAGEVDIWAEQVGEGPEVLLIGGLGDTVEIVAVPAGRTGRPLPHDSVRQPGCGQDGDAGRAADGRGDGR